MHKLSIGESADSSPISQLTLIIRIVFKFHVNSHSTVVSPQTYDEKTMCYIATQGKTNVLWAPDKLLD